MTSDRLILARRAAETGMTEALRSARATGGLVALRRGVYVAGAETEKQSKLDRYRMLSIAVGQQRRQPVYAGFTAGVLHGLPVVGRIPADVFLLSPTASGRRRNKVVEFGRRDRGDLVEVGGHLLTSIPDTIIDVARSSTLLQALTMADAALHVDRFGRLPPLCTPADLRVAYERRLPFPGSRRVAAVLDRATELAESPLETLSRLRIEELGFPAPVLQYPVTLPSGSMVYLDLAWPAYRVWGEADGDGKYLGNFVSAGDPRSPAQIVIDEKKRESDVRASLRWDCDRWDWMDAWSSTPLLTKLLRLGLPRFPRRPPR